MTLRRGSLATDVNTMLTPENGYAVKCFFDSIERVLQNNTQIMVDDNLELTVSILTHNKNGGAYRKLRELAHKEVICKNWMHSFCPSNI